MKRALRSLFRSSACRVAVGVLAASALLCAQDPQYGPSPSDSGSQPSSGSSGWRRVGDNSAPQEDQNYPPQASQPAPPQAPPDGRIPPQLTLQPGTFVTLRLNQTLSSDVNQPGDAFSGSLVKPIVVDGVVVAQRGQTIGGRVSDAQKAGRAQGVSHLGLQLTDLTLVDGTQAPIQSQLISRTGPASVGRDAGTIVGTTALGAAVGAAADWGRGAAIGAGVGAAAGTVGVLLTRGRPTIIYPESVLTFRIDAPVTISTERAPQAFRYVSSYDYDRPGDLQTRRAPPEDRYAYGYPAPRYYYGYPGYYPYYYDPFYYPGFSFYYGPRFYWGPHFYGGGFHRGFGGYHGGFHGRR